MAGELILIIEDNEKNRRLVRDALRFRGFRTIECERGEDALPLVQVADHPLQQHLGEADDGVERGP